jgi:peptide/nickel transport system ATP-binding protein
MSLLLITHDLGVVAESCRDVAVMYAGHIVEQAPTEALFAQPRHPYTAGLLRSVPALRDRSPEARTSRHLHEIPGTVPPLDQLPRGCRFQDRCERAQERCRKEAPPLELISADRLVRCFYPIDAPHVAAA